VLPRPPHHIQVPSPWPQRQRAPPVPRAAVLHPVLTNTCAETRAPSNGRDLSLSNAIQQLLGAMLALSPVPCAASNNLRNLAFKDTELAFGTNGLCVRRVKRVCVYSKAD